MKRNCFIVMMLTGWAVVLTAPAYAISNGRGQEIITAPAVFNSSATVLYSNAVNAGLTVSSGMIVNNGTVGLAIAGGGVGIGTASPTAKLHVSGGILTVDGADAGITTVGGVDAASGTFIAGVTASSFTATSASLGVDTAKIRFTNDNMVISSATIAQYGGLYVSTHAYFATDSGIYNVSTITASGRISAASYQMGGVTVLSSLPSQGLSIGLDAGQYNSAGTVNTFIGNFAGQNNTGGTQNTFVGYSAGQNNNGGTDNLFVGYIAGGNNTTGSKNTYIGSGAGSNNYTGLYNTSVGYNALQMSKYGSGNTAVGFEAVANTSALQYSSNTVVGYRAGYDLRTGGNNNILIGWKAGDGITTGTDNLVIGYDQDTSVVEASNELNIGGVLFGNLSSKVIGISTRTPKAALDIVSTGTASDVMAQIWRDSAGTIVSSMSVTGLLSLNSMTASGNVGIGTNDPGARLEVQETDGAHSYSLRVGTGTTAYHVVVTTSGSIGFGTPTPASSARVDIKGADSGATGYGLGVRNSADVYNLVVRNDGNTGVGTITPASTLQVGAPVDATLHYMQIDTLNADTAGPPPDGDCDASVEVGRMIVSTRYSATAEFKIWVCVQDGASSFAWKSATLN